MLLPSTKLISQYATFSMDLNINLAMSGDFLCLCPIVYLSAVIYFAPFYSIAHNFQMLHLFCLKKI